MNLRCETQFISFCKLDFLPNVVRLLYVQVMGRALAPKASWVPAPTNWFNGTLDLPLVAIDSYVIGDISIDLESGCFDSPD